MRETIIQIYNLILTAFGASLTGVGGWFAKKILFYGGQALIDIAYEFFRRKSRDSKQDKKEKEMEQVNKDPNSTPEDRAKAYEDYINS
jgi:hypothetical protein